MKKYALTPLVALFCLISDPSFAGPRRPLPAPKPLIESDYAPGSIPRICKTQIGLLKARLDVLSRMDGTRNKQMVREFDKILADFSDKTEPVIFMKESSTQETTRKEAGKCEEDAHEAKISIFASTQLYKTLKATGAVKGRFTGAELRLYESIIREFEENGLKLPDEKRTQVVELKKELAKIESQYATQLAEDKTTLELTAEELAGVPEDFLKGLQKTAEGKFILTSKGPHYERVMQNAKLGETRKKMLLLWENRAAATNTQLLQNAIDLRQKIAGVMGFDTWADYKSQRKMAKNARTVFEFLDGLKSKLSQKNQEDLQMLLKFKQDLEPGAKAVQAWDIGYLIYQLKKRDYSLDDDLIRDYFPAETVVKGMFQVYSKILGVDYVEQKGAKVWAEGVKLYAVHDTRSGEKLGYFYTDFFPREGKYNHAAAFPLIVGRKVGGKFTAPVSAILTNFNAPTADKPSLLNHNEVSTLFHEFGHIMHMTLTRVDYGNLSGASVAWDFVEAPSQMLENWTYSPEVLNLISGHYLDPNKKLPKDVLDKLVLVRDFMNGYTKTRQLVFGLFDYYCHTQKGAIDVTKLYYQVYSDLTGVAGLEGGHFPASFGHLMGGYDAGYYGYLWSLVYAYDMFTRFETEGLLNPKTGRDYRREILEKGDTRDALDLVTHFLGRKPNAEAFYKALQIKKN